MTPVAFDLRRRSQVIGVMPEALSGQGDHRGLTELRVVDSMHERKAVMADRASGFIALPGGYGTLDEVLEILTWNQIGTIAKPVAFLDVNGYFSNLFRSEVGMSFSDYLIQVRVENAKCLLRRFDLSVEDISKKCGFNSLAHFSRTFKDRCGQSPLKYRKSPQAVN